MRRFASVIACAFAICAADARAQAGQAPGATTAVAADSTGLVRVASGTVIEVEVAEALSSERNRRGDVVKLRLAEPIVVGGRAVVAAGAMGAGEVVDARRSGGGGSPGILVVSGRSLEINGARVPLRSNITLGGANNVSYFGTPQLDFLDPSSPGGAANIEAGKRMRAVTLADFDAPPVNEGASQSMRVAAATSPETPDQMESGGQIGPPPAGKGQIVFFRPRRNSAAVYQYTVREGEREIARLPNGTYAIVAVEPGIHEYGIGGPFIFGDRPRTTLRLDVLPGETYYVAHAIEFMAPSQPDVFARAGLTLSTAELRR